eukprot:Hpha_TRINITY_DN15187_c5_g4::TRINITY_DN15187_c5_g4_i1::g.129449::m.129449
MGGALAAAATGGAFGGGTGAFLYYAMADDQEQSGIHRCGVHCAAGLAGAAGGVACLPLHATTIGIGQAFAGPASAGTVLCEAHRACGANVLTGFLAACRMNSDGGVRQRGGTGKAGEEDPEGIVTPNPNATPLLSRLASPPKCSYSTQLPGLFALSPGEGFARVLCRWTPQPAHVTTPRVVVLYFHAAGTDLGGCVAECAEIAELLEAPVLAVEYAGFGHACRSGSASPLPKESSLALLRRDIDAAAATALRYLTAELGVSPMRVLVVGRGEGCGPACSLTALSEQALAGLLLIDPIATVRGNHVEGWATLAHVPQSRCPLLLVAGADDAAEAEWLFVAASAAHVRGAGTLLRYYVPSRRRGEVRVTEAASSVVGPFLGKVTSVQERAQALPIPRETLRRIMSVRLEDMSPSSA